MAVDAIIVNSMQSIFCQNDGICLNLIHTWRGVRVVDGDALEMRFGETQRGFKSPPLRYCGFSSFCG